MALELLVVLGALGTLTPPLLFNSLLISLPAQAYPSIPLLYQPSILLLPLSLYRLWFPELLLFPQPRRLSLFPAAQRTLSDAAWRYYFNE